MPLRVVCKCYYVVSWYFHAAAHERHEYIPTVQALRANDGDIVNAIMDICSSIEEIE